MTRLLSTLVVVLTFFTAISHGADAVAAVKLADAARVKATMAGDGQSLAELLSDDLLYGQNNGEVQTKAEFINAVVNNQVKYEAFDYEDTRFRQTAPTVVTMTGLVHLKVSRGATRAEFSVRFLAVWREEKGQWRLQAYQSTLLPEAASPAVPKPKE